MTRRRGTPNDTSRHTTTILPFKTAPRQPSCIKRRLALDAVQAPAYLTPKINRPDGTALSEQKTPEKTRNASSKILGAARTIAAREGAGKVTIDAVAKESGLSKGGVLYNYPTKKALLSGLLDQMLIEHRELVGKVSEQSPSQTLHGHLMTVFRSGNLNEDLSMAILAASASDPRLLDPLRDEMTSHLEHILTETSDPAGAMIAVLAIQGMRFQKLLDLPNGGAALREPIIERLRKIIDELD